MSLSSRIRNWGRSIIHSHTQAADTKQIKRNPTRYSLSPISDNADLTNVVAQILPYSECYTDGNQTTETGLLPGLSPVSNPETQGRLLHIDRRIVPGVLNKDPTSFSQETLLNCGEISADNNEGGFKIVTDICTRGGILCFSPTIDTFSDYGLPYHYQIPNDKTNMDNPFSIALPMLQWNKAAWLIVQLFVEERNIFSFRNYALHPISTCGEKRRDVCKIVRELDPEVAKMLLEDVTNISIGMHPEKSSVTLKVKGKFHSTLSSAKPFSYNSEALETGITHEFDLDQAHHIFLNKVRGNFDASIKLFVSPGTKPTSSLKTWQGELEQELLEDAIIPISKRVKSKSERHEDGEID
ncbi:MAG: hypothetical protein ABIE74_09540 [Pseudomonadota bacterium]